MNPTVPKQKRGLRASTAILLLLAWIAVLAAIAYNRQNIIDWWRLKHYTPSATVAQLATDDTMSAYARKIWYVNHPQLQAKADFKNCNLGTERAAVLGCYKSDQAGIFVLTVTDPRLDGVEQVTTAHEMLHAAYDRLSAKQKQYVNGLLEDYYKHDLKDPTIIEQMNGYKQSEPNDLVNEMHSVFGTEVANLPAPLEQYYKQYFTDRSKIAGYYTKYEAEFTTRQTQIKADDAQLGQWRTQIDSMESDLKGRYSALQAQQAQLNALKSSGNITGYNAGVPAYNQLVNAYNAEVAQLKSVISQYNQLVETRNSIALETQQLANEITSNTATIDQ